MGSGVTAGEVGGGSGVSTGESVAVGRGTTVGRISGVGVAIGIIVATGIGNEVGTGVSVGTVTGGEVAIRVGGMAVATPGRSTSWKQPANINSIPASAGHKSTQTLFT